MKRPALTNEASSFLKLVVAIVSILLVFSGGVFVGSRAEKAPEFASFLIKEKPIDHVSEAEKVIKENFYQKVDQKTLDKGKQEGMITALGDEFSHYLDGQMLSDFNTRTSGEYVGVGIQVDNADKKVMVINVLSDSPAEEAGIKSGDRIIAINNESIKGQDATFAASKVRGKTGTKVSLTVVRKGEKKEFDIERGAVTLTSVNGKELRRENKRYRYVYLNSFSNSTAKDLENEIKLAKAKNNQGMIIDLRANGGGLVESAVEIGAFFLPKNTLMVSIKGRQYKEQKYTTFKKPIWNKPLVILVDRQTASASEILAAALQDNKRAKIIGTKTYGKGVVQRMFPLSNGASIDLTVAEYFTPSGKSLTKVGVRPDIKAKNNKTDEAYKLALEALDN